MGGDGGAIEAGHIVQRGGQADAFNDGRGAGFETGRRIGIGDALAADFADHLAAAIEGAHGFQMRLLGIQHADAGGAIQLVAGDDVEIDVQRLHVNNLMHRALAAIGQHRHALGMSTRFDDFGQRRDQCPGRWTCG